MTATVHPLFPRAATERERVTHPLVGELMAESQRRLDELLRRMFDSADDLLFELSERAPNDAERRSYFDTMRVVRLDRLRISASFAEQVQAGFQPGGNPRGLDEAAFDLDRLSIQPTEELEEKIALTNMAAKAEGLHRSQLWELQQRLERAAREFGVPVSSQALDPVRLCAAFGAALAVLTAEFRIKLVIYKLFDRAVVQQLGTVFDAALALLEAQGIRVTRRSSGGGVPMAPAIALPSASAAPSPTASSPVDPAAIPDAGLGPVPHPTLDLLRRHGLDPADLIGSGDPAARELGASLQTLLGLPSLSAVQASTQRLSMASRMFDELLSEPLLPEALRPALEGLRYPAYRAALTDQRFFTDAAHPLRRSIAELVELVLAAQTGDLPASHLGESVQRVQQQTPSSGGFGFTTLAGARQLPAVEVDRFAAQLRDQARALRETLLLRVRRQVAQELDLHTGARQVPPLVQPLLRSGLGPLMAIRMLRDGRASEPFHQAEALLDRILDSLDYTPPPHAVQLADRERLNNDIATAFSGIGMAADKVETLLNGLRQVYADLDRPTVPVGQETAQAVDDLSVTEAELLMTDFAPRPVDTASAPAPISVTDDLPKVTPMELLSRILTPESWFRVFDASHEQTRWLRLSSYYPQQDSVTFSGFDEANRLVLHASRLVDDLALGHSEPVNPTPAAREALEQLRNAKAHGLF